MNSPCGSAELTLRVPIFLGALIAGGRRWPEGVVEFLPRLGLEVLGIGGRWTTICTAHTWRGRQPREPRTAAEDGYHRRQCDAVDRGDKKVRASKSGTITVRQHADGSGRQRRLQQGIAVMLAIAVELVVQSLQVGFDRKLRIKREDVADMSSGGDRIAQHGRGRSKEGMVDLVGTTYAPERVDRLGVAAGDKKC